MGLDGVPSFPTDLPAFALYRLLFVFLTCQQFPTGDRPLPALWISNCTTTQGLSTLKWDDSLAAAARKHAAEMLKHNSVSHQFPGEPSLPTRAHQAGVRFTWISENVDQGRGAEIIHDRLMKSPLHRSNILDRDMNTVGVGVAQGKGQLFVVEDFSKAE